MKYLRTLILAVTAFVAIPAPAQISSGALQSIYPLTRDTAALSTFTARTAATVNSADQSGFNVTRVICAFNQSSYTGAPSTTFSIQNKDAASGKYYTLVTSAAITSATTLNVPIPLAVGGSVISSANLSAGIPIARTWRVSTTVAGTSTPTIWGTVGCSVQ